MAAEKRLSNENVTAEQRTAINEVAERHGARAVRVFGSIARRESNSGSDLDLLVDLEPGRDLLDLVAIKQVLEEQLGLSVDVLTEGALSPYMLEEVLRDARPL